MGVAIAPPTEIGATSLLKLYEKIEGRFSVLKEWDAIILAVLLLVIFLLSYRKQTSYIKRRTKIING
jgi:hypothetical protein